MKKKILGMFLVLGLLWFVGCSKDSPTTPETPQEPAQTAPTIVSLNSTDGTILFTQITELEWNVKDATSITIDNGVGDVTGRTSVEVSPEETTEYTLTASNSVGQVSATCQIEVKEAIRLVMIGEPVPMYRQWPDKKEPTFHGYEGTIKNIGNKKCGKGEYSFHVKMYDKNGVILFDLIFQDKFGSFQKFPTIFQGQTADWAWSWYWRSLYSFKCPEKAQLVDVSKTTFEFRYPNWQKFE